jgi:Leucine-rich repeat (LRR) protein
MFTIVLPNQAISKIDALSECENVVILNLSGNTIQDLTPLSKLTQLKIVDLSDNSISNVDCFEGFEELVNLKLSGNMIKGLESLKSLQSCIKLKNLHLQTLGGDNQNPICQLNGYRDNLLSYLKQIGRLDSIPREMQLSNGS